MCEHGDVVRMPVVVMARVAHRGEDTVKVKPIDRCIAPIVKALNDAGIYMLGSCCGHGKKMGEILLADGRIVWVHQTSAGVAAPIPTDALWLRLARLLDPEHPGWTAEIEHHGDQTQLTLHDGHGSILDTYWADTLSGVLHAAVADRYATAEGGAA